MIDRAERIAGVILGTAVGDALGLPREGLSRRRAMRLFGDGPLRHRLIAGRGMVSDDTEHACLVAQALLEAPGRPDEFAHRLAWGLRWWLVRLPAGVGLATARSILKLWCGFPPEKSGVWSAGNGPAMRAPLLGACLADDRDRLASFIRASTRLTHVDPRAEAGALLVGSAAAHASQRSVIDTEAFLNDVAPIGVDDAEFQALLETMRSALQRNLAPAEFADSLGLHNGVSGYIYHTAPVAVYCWLHFRGAFREAVEAAICLGGDSDTVGAIVGALCGAVAGPQKIPEAWLSGLLDWPCSERRLRGLAARLANRVADSAERASAPREILWPGQLVRNILFLSVVLAHGFRRLLPPY